MNCFIHAVGEQESRGVQSQEARYFAFDRLAVWGASQIFRIHRAHPRQHSGGTADCALIEIKPQSLPSSKWWMVGLEFLHRRASFKHERTSPLAIRRVRASLPLERGRSPREQFSECLLC